MSTASEPDCMWAYNETEVQSTASGDHAWDVSDQLLAAWIISYYDQNRLDITYTK